MLRNPPDFLAEVLEVQLLSQRRMAACQELFPSIFASSLIVLDVHCEGDPDAAPGKYQVKLVKLLTKLARLMSTLECFQNAIEKAPSIQVKMKMSQVCN